MWYVAQCFKIEKNIISQILKKAFKFIYAGENERPVQVLNFRDKSLVGLGLVNPLVKCKAHLIKSMAKDFLLRDGNLTDWLDQNFLYGYMEDVLRVARNDLLKEPAKQIFFF